MSEPRASWDEYFMRIAETVATRSTCPRKFVGAVIVRDKTILSTGYNGSIRGMPHCSDVGHMMENDHCVATIHAEANAIIQAAKNGVTIDNATIYVTASPCWTCFKHIANAGLRKICFREFYRDPRIFEVAQTIGIELLHLPNGAAHTSPPVGAGPTINGRIGSETLPFAASSAPRNTVPPASHASAPNPDPPASDQKGQPGKC